MTNNLSDCLPSTHHAGHPVLVPLELCYLGGSIVGIPDPDKRLVAALPSGDVATAGAKGNAGYGLPGKVLHVVLLAFSDVE